jgi:AcrR family transcriptional regulator
VPAATSPSTRPKRRVRTRLDPEVRRAQIIDAAEAVLLDRDPVELSFERVADAAGVSRGLVYNYFGDKSGLLAAVYLRNFERLTDAVEAATESTTHDTEARIRSLVDAYVAFVGENLSTRTLLGTPEAMEHPAVRYARREHAKAIAAIWDDTPEARVLACGIVGFLEAAVIEWIEETELTPDRAAEVIHDQLWAGLGHGIPGRRSVQPGSAQPGRTVSTARQQYHAATVR